MTTTLIPPPTVSVEELEKLFSHGIRCEYGMRRSLEADRNAVRCKLPATWLWLFKLGCEHPRDRHHLCATHHVLLGETDNKWTCITCGSISTVIMRRRI